jgi:hypothetical protein
MSCAESTRASAIVINVCGACCVQATRPGIITVNRALFPVRERWFMGKYYNAMKNE